MSYPGPVIPPVFGTQNLRDDDGAVIDSFLIETDAPPTLKDATQTIDAPDVEKIKPQTKLITKTQLIDPAWSGPTQLLPGDANRHGVGIRVWSPTLVATDGMRIASDIGEVNSAGIVLHSQTLPGDALSDHTGPVYALPASLSTTGPGVASAIVYATVWAVTE
jgi:hypothetical protein